MRRPNDPFVYTLVIVNRFEDALNAVSNEDIQTCLIRYEWPREYNDHLRALLNDWADCPETEWDNQSKLESSLLLGRAINHLRPEIDQFLVTQNNEPIASNHAIRHINQIFYNDMPYLQRHRAILDAINQRFCTPFFDALREYSHRPIESFHSLPIAHSKSLINSQWTQHVVDYFGPNGFMTESSATCGGLDSLHQPHGPIRDAQQSAARAFGAQKSFFVTNGTSTANKIAMQALIKPRDIVLIDRNCHKSHHYSAVLSGARVCYLDAYPLDAYSMYGAVPLRHIKQTLLAYKRAGQLDQVKMLALTNCTFDGVVYNVRRVMEECLAIKPDLVFLWDEAWFAFATFHPLYRPRTAMHAANALRERYRSGSYRREYATWKQQSTALNPDDDATWLDHRLMPNPDDVRIRVYATQSTHKTLTAMRQGSMIHLFDQDYSQKVEQRFHNAYMTHTSTSPNYQIIASLDIGRMQVEMEGFKRVRQQLETALSLRKQINSHPLLSRYFHVLTNGEMVPEVYRESGLTTYCDKNGSRHKTKTAWIGDEFVLDPTRLTLVIDRTGIEGDLFKTDYLMNQFNIQVNKTSHNTVLFMTNIATSHNSITYLIDALIQMARRFDSHRERTARAQYRPRKWLPLPDFSHFHAAFRSSEDCLVSEGDIRNAYFLGYDDDNVEYLRIDNNELQQQILFGRDVVSACFVTPYPPGFPILVPGQILNLEILHFLQSLGTTEIHGYHPETGLQVFKKTALLAHAGKPSQMKEILL